MWVYSMYGRANFVKKLDYNKGYEFSISLGKDKGFSRVIYYSQGREFPIIKNNMDLFIPKGDISAITYVNKNGEQKTIVKIITNYVEAVEETKRTTIQGSKSKKGKEEEEPTQENSEDQEIQEPTIRESDVLKDDENWELDL